MLESAPLSATPFLPDNIGKASVRSTQRLEPTGGKGGSRILPNYRCVRQRNGMGLVENWPLPARRDLGAPFIFALMRNTAKWKRNSFACGYVKK